jgi:hypothetical protein
MVAVGWEWKGDVVGSVVQVGGNRTGSALTVAVDNPAWAGKHPASKSTITTRLNSFKRMGHHLPFTNLRFSITRKST